MKKLILLVTTMLLVLPSFAQKGKTYAQSQRTQQGFAQLAKYNDEKYYPYVDALMHDRAIQGALKKLMGSDYKKYEQNTQQVDITDALVGSDGVLRAYVRCHISTPSPKLRLSLSQMALSMLPC